ncbi:MAG: type VI secretion system tip protein TssI/VgrG [Polyangiaceae bacterium]
MSNVELEAAGHSIRVGHFTVQEAMSAAFRIHATGMGSDEADIRRWAGKPATFTLRSNRGTRAWHGVVSNVSQTSHTHGHASYSIWIAPRLWLLTHRIENRIFQHKSAPEIVEAVLKPFRIEPVVRMRDEHPKLECRVQYGESDYDFIRRILVEAGISFYFAFGKEETKLVLSDAPNESEPHGEPVPFRHDAEDGDGPHVHGVTMHERVHAHRATFHDHDFLRPHHALAGHHAHAHGHDDELEEHHFEPGHSVAHAAGANGTPIADSHGAYRHRDDLAAHRAKRHIEALQASHSKIGFATNLHDLAPGRVFSVSGHPHKRLGIGKKLLVTETWITGSAEGDWHAGGHAVRTNRRYRPLLTRQQGEALNCSDGGNPFDPVNKLTKPLIHGTQTAIVVGPEGKEVFTDEHGRVRVHFPWDRGGKKGATSACWVRVSQAGAGPGAGMVSVPRIGEEVVVSYLNGDPDQPIIVGRVSNPTTPAPYPATEHGTRSTWRTQDGNEISLDDRGPEDLFYMQASHDLHKLVKHDEVEHTLGDRHVTVEGDLVLHAKGKIIFKAGDEVIVRGHPHVSLNPSEQPRKPKKPRELSSGHHHGKAGASAAANAELDKMHPPHTSESTSNAKAQRSLAQKYMPLAIKLAKKYHLPPALILGWMSRESGLGIYLRPDGYSKFDGYGYGLLQVDRRYHHPTGDPFGAPSCEQAIGDVFASMLRGVKQRHPGWTHDEQIAGALVDYNSGPGNAATRPNSAGGWAAMDRGTAGDDYSRDVWARAQWFAKHLDWPEGDHHHEPHHKAHHEKDADAGGLVLANDKPIH